MKDRGRNFLILIFYSYFSISSFLFVPYSLLFFVYKTIGYVLRGLGALKVGEEGRGQHALHFQIKFQKEIIKLSFRGG